LTSYVRDLASILRAIVRWVLLIAPMSATVGTACALFLWLLNHATKAQFDNHWLLFLLPLAGVAVSLGYHLAGRDSERGNNLIIDEIHEPAAGVPVRMAPLILFSTVVTHLFGGSAGREGTAVQIGGGLASGWDRVFKLSPSDRRVFLMAGVAAGFGAVFGTPLAGAIFAMEVLAIGRLEYAALVPVLNVVYYIDFAKPASTSGGGLLQSVKVTSGLALSQFGSQFALIGTDGKLTAFSLK
jgi:H+/Cl- antiporter ClcA